MTSQFHDFMVYMDLSGMAGMPKDVLEVFYQESLERYESNNRVKTLEEEYRGSFFWKVVDDVMHDPEVWETVSSVIIHNWKGLNIFTETK